MFTIKGIYTYLNIKYRYSLFRTIIKNKYANKN